MSARSRWSFALFAVALFAGVAHSADVEIRVGSARWGPIGETRCGWLAEGPRPVQLLLARTEAASAQSLLVLDGLHAFDLRVDGSAGYAATPLRSNLDAGNQTAPGPLQLPGNAAEGFAELAFDHSGDDCKIRLALPLDMRQLSEGPEFAAEQARLQTFAAVARRLADSTYLLRDKNDPKGALLPGREAYERAREALGANEPLTASAADNLGSVYWNLGEYTAAREMAEFARDTFERSYGADSALAVEARTNLALYRWELGDLAGARAAFERERPLVIAHHGELSNAALTISSNLAGLYSELGLVQQSVNLASFAYLARESRLGPDDRTTLISLNNLASALGQVGRDDDALQLRRLAYERYKSALGARDPDTLRALHNLGSDLCYRSSSDCDLLEQAARARAEVLGAEHPETLFSRGEFGIHLLRQGRSEEALRELEAVYQARLKKLSAQHWVTTLSLAQMGHARALSADPEAGLEQLRSAVASFERLLGPTHTRTLDSLTLLARVCARLQRSQCTRAALETFVERAESERGLDVLSGAQQSTLIPRWVASYRALAQLQADSGATATAVRTIERSKARGLLATLGLKGAEQLSGIPRDAADRIAMHERELATLEDERSRVTDAERLAQIEVRQSAIAHDLAALRADLRARFPKYAAATKVNVPDAAVLARSLAPDEIFLGYAAVPNGFLVYLADARARFHVQELAFPDARAAIEAWRAVIGTPELPALWRLADGSYRAGAARPSADAVRVKPAELGEHLTKVLLDPLRDRLLRYKRWVISPDSALATLPFETLPWQGRHLAESIEIRYSQSLAVYWLLHKRPAVRGSSLFAMGGPTFGHAASDDSDTPDYVAQVDNKLDLRGRASVATLIARSRGDPQATGRAFATLGIDWPPLPGAVREAHAIAALFPGATVFTGDEASEERLQQLNARGDLTQFRYLLFSTHGYLSTEAPALSSIVLRQPGSQGADGYVTAAEWVGYSLRSDLTVLSACETGLGKEVAGEGVMGLPYALFVAGNRNTLLSLWKVPDASTAEFMVRFFRKLRAGTNQVTALAQTKREMMQSARFRDPIHWAGFVLYGS